MLSMASMLKLLGMLVALLAGYGADCKLDERGKNILF